MAIEYKKYRLVKITPETDGVRTFTLVPMEGPVPAFLAGQFFNIRLSEPRRGEGQEFPRTGEGGAPPPRFGIKPNFRSYSVLAPHAPEQISFGIKLEGVFTHLLFEMKGGEEAELAGPFGKFIVKEEEKRAPLVFLAGGIGITPLYCMAKELADNKTKTRSVLFYSNREEKDVAYRKDLERIAHENNKNFSLVLTLTGDNVPRNWAGEKGRIDRAMLLRHRVDFSSSHFYLCGSPAFVKGVVQMLNENNVDAARIHKEQW